MVKKSLPLKWALCAMALNLAPLGAFAQETTEPAAPTAPAAEETAAPAAESSAMEEEGGSPFILTVDNTFATMYVWRGIRFVDDWVWQPSVTVGAQLGDNAALTFNVWGDFPMEGDGTGDFDELDYTVDFTTALCDAVSLSVGAIYYYFPNTGGSDTTEVYGKLAFNVPLAPYVVWYQDVDEADGAYVQAGIGHTLSLVEDEAVTAGMALGASVAWASENWSGFNYGVEDDGLADGFLSVGFPIGMLDGHVTFTPGVKYAVLLDDDVRDAHENVEDSLYFTLSLTVGL